MANVMSTYRMNDDTLERVEQFGVGLVTFDEVIFGKDTFNPDHTIFEGGALSKEQCFAIYEELTGRVLPMDFKLADARALVKLALAEFTHSA